MLVHLGFARFGDGSKIVQKCTKREPSPNGNNLYWKLRCVYGLILVSLFDKILFRRNLFLIRKIIHIDEEKCNGCGLCANACHEGAIDMVDGKAKLVRENFCDGFGDCLPACPTGAISFEEREAPEYDEAAVKAAQQAKGAKPMGCPGSVIREMNRSGSENDTKTVTKMVSQLRNWPVQIKLAPTKAPYFDNAKLLVAADCTAFAYASFHEEFIRGKVTLIGCPKLDSVDYSEKLTEIIKNNNIQSVQILRMEVPCCGGLELATKNALKASGKFIPWNVVTISIDGKIVD